MLLRAPVSDILPHPSPPLRIAMMVSGAGINGAVKYVLLLTRFLAGRGHRILLLHRPGAWIARQQGLDGVELFATSFARRPTELLRVNRRLNAFAPDLLHTHMSSAHSYGMINRIFGTRPVVATAHSQSFQLHWMFNTMVIATSPGAAAYHHKYNRVARSKLREQTNFIDVSDFPVPTQQAREAARRTFGFAPADVVIGCVGEVGERKRQLDLIKAMPAVLRRVPSARLMLVGNDHAGARAALEAAVEQLHLKHQVSFTGPRNDIQHVLAALDIFALVSQKETGPLAVLEAMATGLPVLVSAVGSLPDFVQDGARGYVVRTGDVDAIVERLAQLGGDPALRARLGQAAAAAVRSDYDIAQAGPRIEALLLEVAAMKARSPSGFAGGRFRR